MKLVCTMLPLLPEELINQFPSFAHFPCLFVPYIYLFIHMFMTPNIQEYFCLHAEASNQKNH